MTESENYRFANDNIWIFIDATENRMLFGLLTHIVTQILVPLKILTTASTACLPIWGVSSKALYQRFSPPTPLATLGGLLLPLVRPAQFLVNCVPVRQQTFPAAIHLCQTTAAPGKNIIGSGKYQINTKSSCQRISKLSDRARPMDFVCRTEGKAIVTSRVHLVGHHPGRGDSPTHELCHLEIESHLASIVLTAEDNSRRGSPGR